jgi:nitrate/nitrite transport system ATP-binding protein
MTALALVRDEVPRRRVHETPAAPAAPAAAAPYLRVDALRKDFRVGRETVTAVRDVSLEIGHGEFVAFIGHSGCGKSTVLNMVAGVYPPTSGAVTLDGRPVTGPGPDRAMVFQSYSLLPWLTVEDNVFQAVDAVLAGRMSPRDRRAHAERFLRMVHLWDHRRKRPGEISGGMRQRVAIARAFAVQPDVLLLDEPFGALDALTKGALHDELLGLWRGEGRRQTILMVTHDIDEAIYLADRVVVMTDGPAATVREVIDVPLERPREKRGVIHDPHYLDVKDRLLTLLQGEPGPHATDG